MGDKRWTDKKERFAQLIVETGNQTEALRQAYNYKEKKADWLHAKASVLANQEMVKERVAQLKLMALRKHEISRDDIIKMYISIINTHEGIREAFGGNPITPGDLKKIYAMSNSGYIRGSDVLQAINRLSEMMGHDKPQSVRETENKIVIEIHRKDSNE